MSPPASLTGLRGRDFGLRYPGVNVSQVNR